MTSYRLPPTLSLLVLLIASSGCHTKNQMQTETKDASTPCVVGNDYFPPAGNSETGSLHFGVDQADWESNYLKHLGEHSLYACGSANAEPEYRFLWDRSLSEPIAVRMVVHPDGSGTLFVRMLKNGGLLPPTAPGKKEMTWDEWLKIKIDNRIDLTSEQVQHALNLFSQIEFRAGTVKTPGETTDGSDWIFESRVANRYKLVDFRNEPSKAARQFGLYMVLELGKVPIPADAIY
jgi:hypothetical protein